MRTIWTAPYSAFSIHFIIPTSSNPLRLLRQLFLFLQQDAALTREHYSFFDKSTVACVDCKPFALFLGVIAVTILYLTVFLNFAIDGRLDQFFMILVKGLERILSAPLIL